MNPNKPAIGSSFVVSFFSFDVSKTDNPDDSGSKFAIEFWKMSNYQDEYPHKCACYVPKDKSVLHWEEKGK